MLGEKYVENMHHSFEICATCTTAEPASAKIMHPKLVKLVMRLRETYPEDALGA